MIRKSIITLLILHTIFIWVSNSLINNSAFESRLLKKADPSRAAIEGKNFLKEGDMIFRLNMDAYSQFIKRFNRYEKKYSHAGIVIIENGVPVVYHMVNGEENNNNKMLKSSYEEFVNPKKNYAFGIYRNELSEKEIYELSYQIKEWYNKGIEFDFDLNLESDDKMYCSEMIAKAIAKATNNRIKITSTELTHKEAIAFAAYSKQPYAYTENLKVVAIDNLYTHKWSSVVKEYRFY